MDEFSSPSDLGEFVHEGQKILLAAKHVTVPPDNITESPGDNQYDFDQLGLIDQNSLPNY